MLSHAKVHFIAYLAIVIFNNKTGRHDGAVPVSVIDLLATYLSSTLGQVYKEKDTAPT